MRKYGEINVGFLIITRIMLLAIIYILNIINAVVLIKVKFSL